MQVAKPAEMYERPNSRWVADFIGEISIDRGHAVAAAGRDGQRPGRAAGADRLGMRSMKRVWLALRPEKIALSA